MTNQPQEGVIEVRLRWQDASDLPTLYANQVYITHSGKEFYVIFGEVQLPVLVSATPEELGEVEELEVRPVAKLVFTPEGIIPVVDTMAENVRKFLERRERMQGEEEN